MDAVTAGKLTVTAAGNGASTIVLAGTDGVTYTYRDVNPGQLGHKKVSAGARIGLSGPGGFTFSISVPDVRGAVDAAEALQAWAGGLTVNVRSLPTTIAPATAPKRSQVLVVTGPGVGAGAGTAGTAEGAGVTAATSAGAAAADLAKSLTGQFVTVRAGTVGDLRSQRSARLAIVVMPKGTPAQAAALAARLPSGHDLLWVAPPGTTPKQAAVYRAIVAAHPGFRVEALPAALAAANAPTGALATATMTAVYAATAYRLPSIPVPARSAVSWAEQQLGKPYQWAAAGPASFDCSGLTMDALAQTGITVTHNANAQWRQTRSRPVSRNRLAAGDLVFFAGSDGTLTAPGHVGIYVGNGEIIDAPFTGANVRFDPLASIGGYVAATNPYASALGIGGAFPAVAAGGGLQASPLAPPIAVPGTLNQYQSFAQTLVNSTWGSGQFGYLSVLWERESGWNPAATNPVSGAFGIPQALPASKMASAGLDWASDPYTQIIWGIDYIRAAYGSPRAAWAHELAFGWY